MSFAFPEQRSWIAACFRFLCFLQHLNVYVNESFQSVGLHQNLSEMCHCIMKLLDGCALITHWSDVIAAKKIAKPRKSMIFCSQAGNQICPGPHLIFLKATTEWWFEGSISIGSWASKSFFADYHWHVVDNFFLVMISKPNFGRMVSTEQTHGWRCELGRFF